MRYETILRSISVDFESPNLVPSKDRIFAAFELCELDETKVVILGQDPYPNKKNAHGLSFSVPADRPIPPSLRNVFKELKSDLGVPTPKTGDLTSWARQGVLLLNTILTTEDGVPLAHQDRGWEEFTDKILRRLVAADKPLVVVAWGKHAKDKVKNIETNHKVLVLEGGHPSPLNRLGGFLGNRYFSKANNWLRSHGVDPVNWRLP